MKQQTLFFFQTFVNDSSNALNKLTRRKETTAETEPAQVWHKLSPRLSFAHLPTTHHASQTEICVECWKYDMMSFSRIVFGNIGMAIQIASLDYSEDSWSEEQAVFLVFNHVWARRSSVTLWQPKWAWQGKRPPWWIPVWWHHVKTWDCWHGVNDRFESCVPAIQHILDKVHKTIVCVTLKCSISKVDFTMVETAWKSVARGLTPYGDLFIVPKSGFLHVTCVPVLWSHSELLKMVKRSDIE